MTGAGTRTFGALSSFGRLLLDGTEPADSLASILPQPVDHILVQADLTIIAPGPLEPTLGAEIALVAELKAPKGEEKKILGVGRLSKQHGNATAEFAVLVSDEWHGQGLGTELLRRLIEIGRVEKLTQISGQVLAENHAMHHICRKVGFQVVHDADSNLFTASYTY